MACGTKREFEEKDIATQPGAKVGDLVRCPVSNAAFDVKADSPFIEKDGKRIYTCCGGCFAQFQSEPARFLAKVERQNAEHVAPGCNGRTDARGSHERAHRHADFRLLHRAAERQVRAAIPLINRQSDHFETSLRDISR